MLEVTGPVEHARDIYGYVPTRNTTIVFIVLFSLSTAVHMAQIVRSRTWHFIPTVGLCGALEIIGWSGRLWSSISPQLDPPFIISITNTILAPSPLLAANFILSSGIIRRLGPVYSRLGARGYSITFCTANVVAFIVQLMGTGLVAASLTRQEKDPTVGVNIVLEGIIIQLAMITFHILLMSEFIVRYVKNAHVLPVSSRMARHCFMNRDLLMVGCALAFSSTCLFIRTLYRTIELRVGWDRRIFRTEIYFTVFDGAMVVLAIYSLHLAHITGLSRSQGHLDASDSMGLARIGTANPEHSQVT
ncbi:putative RTA1 like protein [Lyophyllum shimeji]|uniref:RTA1 like protein n=1 Tax=Lyophyllum shimeji TaxID=47721 RepID=A0A9P3PNS8_LYOSH|nr:putative RTA1 like protein [Lyophyllum shimeji]